MKRLLVLAILTIVTACGDAAVHAMTREGYESHIKQEIAAGKSCESDADCVIAFPGCPFGCATPMNAKTAENVKALVGEYQKQNPDNICKYKCAAIPEKAVCVNNQCEAAK